jgi:carbonic anhydrase/acetyltransferase-like protein (isoleucine patch superfamily)
MKKYKLLLDKKIKTASGVNLYRIKALRDFGEVEKGDIGGYLQSEKNLSHEGNAWVYEDAWVFGNAKVYGNAEVSGEAEVFNNAQIYDNARVFGNTEVFDNAQVYGNAKIFDDAKVFGNALIYGNAWVLDNVCVFGNAEVYDDARIRGKAQVYSNTWICDTAKISDEMCICDGVITHSDIEGNPQNNGITQESNNIENSLNHPEYYGGDSPYEVLKVIQALGLGFELGNVLKYIARAGKKDPATEIEDLKKAQVYLNRCIQFREAKINDNKD